MPFVDESRLPRRFPGSVYFLCITLGALIWAAFPPVAYGGDPARGKTLYERWCAACHGKSGEGIGNMPSLRDAQFMGSRTDRDLFRVITQGKQGTGMPPFPMLSEEDRWNIISYLRMLSRP